MTDNRIIGYKCVSVPKYFSQLRERHNKPAIAFGSELLTTTDMVRVMFSYVPRYVHMIYIPEVEPCTA